MAEAPLRYKRLIRELPKHKTATEAIRSAGFAESTAQKQQKRILQSALKHQAREILEADTISGKSKALMNELIGLSREELFMALKKIATQDKDYGSALKVLAPLAKQHDVILSTEEQAQVTVPILNVTVKKNEPDES